MVSFENYEKNHRSVDEREKKYRLRIVGIFENKYLNPSENNLDTSSTGVS